MALDVLIFLQWIDCDVSRLWPRDYITILRAVHLNLPLQAIGWFKWVRGKCRTNSATDHYCDPRYSFDRSTNFEENVVNPVPVKKEA